MSATVPLTKDNPARVQRDAAIVERRLEGASYREIADEMGIHNSTVCRILNDSECRDIIKTGTKELLTLVPKAVDNYRTFLSSSDNNYRYKASKDVLETTGIRASRTENPVIQQYFTQVNVSQVPPEVMQFMSNKAQQVTQHADIVTVTPELEPSNDKGLQGDGD